MPRPEQTSIAQGSASWEALINEALEILFDRAIPLPENYVDAAALASTRAPADHEGCIATDLSYNKFYYCDGTDWREIPIASAAGKIASSFLPEATETVVGALETATQAEMDARSVADKIVTPNVLSGLAKHRGLWEDHLATDENTTSASWVAVPNLSVAVTKAKDASKLKITATASLQNTTGGGQVRIKVDGTVVPPGGFGCGATLTNPDTAAQVSVVTGKAAGSFNVTAEWKTGMGTLNCNASSNDDESFCIVVEEID